MFAGGAISFGELHAGSRRVAALLHKAGLRRGDGVAVLLPNRPEFLEITWGCQLSGLYYTPVNTHLTFDEVAYIVEDCEARALFVDSAFAGLAGKLRDNNPRLDLLVCVGGSLPGWRRYEDALAGAGEDFPASDGSEMLYSSGTTGPPKAVRRTLPTDNGSWAQAVLEMALTHRYGMDGSSVYLSPHRCTTPPG